VTQSDILGHGARAPMSAPLRCRLKRLDDYVLDLLVRDGPRGTRSRLIVQAIETLVDEALSPLPDGRIRRTHRARDGGVELARGTLQHDAGAKREATVRAPAANPAFEHLAFRVGDHERRFRATCDCHRPHKIMACVLLLANSFPRH